MKEHEMKTEWGSLWLEDGVMRCVLYTDEHTLEHSISLVGMMKELIESAHPDKKVLLVDYGPCRKQTIDSRKFYSVGPRAAEVADKIALLVKNPITKVIANFFMGINKAQMPCKMFTDEKEAIDWLQEE